MNHVKALDLTTALNIVPDERENPRDGLALHGEGEVGQRDAAQDHHAGADEVHGVAEPVEVQ